MTTDSVMTSLKLRPLALAVLFFFLIAAIPLPAAAEFGIKQEKEVGEKLLSLVSRKFKLIEEPDVVEYINNLGQEIVRASGTTFFDFHFFVIDDREFNAFAAPSGLIFVHSGLIAACENEDELAAVIAHEVGHIQSRHIARQMEKSTKVGIGTLALLIAGIAIGAGPIGNAMIAGSMAANASMALKFSREDEEEADRLAYNWMGEMGRDRGAMLTMLKRMRRISIIQSASLPSYLLTHPDPGARMEYIRDLLQRDKYTRPKTTARPDDFVFKRFRLRIMSLSSSLSGGIGLNEPQKASAAGRKQFNLYGMALNSLEQGDYQNAEKRLRRVEQYFPTQTVIKTDLGVTLFRAGRLAAAEKVLKRAHETNPDAYNTFYLARTLEERGRYNAALKLYRRTGSTLAFSASLHLHQGLCLDALGSHGAAHYHLGLSQWYGGRGKAAIREFKKAMELLPSESPLQKKAEETMKKIKHLEKQKI